MSPKKFLVGSILLGIVVAVLGGALLVNRFRHQAIEEREVHLLQLEDEELQWQIRKVRKGTGNDVRFSGYTGAGTDQKIDQLLGLDGVSEIVFDRADLTDIGLQKLSSMASLNRLAIFGSGISDLGLAAFKNNDSIESLVLVNTNITSRSLCVLSTFRKLKLLVLYDYCDPASQLQLSQKSLACPREPHSLHVLRIGGQWLEPDRDTALRRVKEALGPVNIEILTSCPSADQQGILGRKRPE